MVFSMFMVVHAWCFPCAWWFMMVFSMFMVVHAWCVPCSWWFMHGVFGVFHVHGGSCIVLVHVHGGLFSNMLIYSGCFAWHVMCMGGMAFYMLTVFMKF